MKVKQEVLDKINNPQDRVAIAALLKCGEQNIGSLIDRNQMNGRLTTMQALEAISEVSGIEVSEILEREQVNQPTE